MQPAILRRAVQSSYGAAHPGYGTDWAPRENQALCLCFSSRPLILGSRTASFAAEVISALRASALASPKKSVAHAGLAKHTIMAKAQSCSKGRLRRR